MPAGVPEMRSVMQKKDVIDALVAILRVQIQRYAQPLVDQIISEYGADPYLILISCLLSLRVKDSTTIHVCRKLFAVARTPRQMLAIPRARLERLVYKTGFYRTKARVLHEVSRTLIDAYGGKVPRTEEQLLAIKGVGRKTANLVLALAYGQPAICVDTHVHRISNRLGLIRTKTVEQTEMALKKLLPKKYWGEWNRLLVVWGQHICVPISPKCSRCAIRHLCKRVGVTISR